MTSDEVEIMLTGLRLDGMADAFIEIIGNRSYDDMTTIEVIAKMCIAQKHAIEQRKLARLKRAAKFRYDAPPEDIIWGHKRGLDKQKIRPLFIPDWIKRTENILLSGSTGTGKSWMACAIGYAMVRQGISVKYERTNPVLEKMHIAHLDGTISKFRKTLIRPNLLILDDFGIAPITEQSKEDLFELLEARTDIGSTLIAGQRSPSEWYDYLASDHLADAIMDRIVQRAHIIALKGDSLRARL